VRENFSLEKKEEFLESLQRRFSLITFFFAKIGKGKIIRKIKRVFFS